MLDPSELLVLARSLSAATAPPLSEARLRRAVSTAQYAVFHTVLRAGAERFMGPGTQGGGGYGLIYRGFNHGRMRSVCDALSARKLAPALQRQFGRTSIGREMRGFAGDFASLQDLRHRADYDPSAIFSPPDASNAVDAAEAAVAAFSRTDPDERADVLALMLINPRG